MNKGDKCFRIVWDHEIRGLIVEEATYVGLAVDNKDCSCLYELEETPTHSHKVFSTREEAEKCLKGLEVKLTKKAIVITLPFNILQVVLDGNEDIDYDCKIVDMDEFAKDILYELTREEDRSTPVIRMFDYVMREAVEQGSLGVSGEDDE